MIKLFRFQDELGINKIGANGADEDFICKVCGKSVTEGYVCKITGVICPSCQKVVY